MSRMSIDRVLFSHSGWDARRRKRIGKYRKDDRKWRRARLGGKLGRFEGVARGSEEEKGKRQQRASYRGSINMQVGRIGNEDERERVRRSGVKSKRAACLPACQMMAKHPNRWRARETGGRRAHRQNNQIDSINSRMCALQLFECAPGEDVQTG